MRVELRDKKDVEKRAYERRGRKRHTTVFDYYMSPSLKP